MTSIWLDKKIVALSELIVDSFRQVVGGDLFSKYDLPSHTRGAELSEALFYSRSAVLSHDRVEKSGKYDNLYTYANQTALHTFERTFEEQVGLSSAQSASSNATPQSTRNHLLAQALANGFVCFSAERLSKTGSTVMLHDAILFNLIDHIGIYRGQAVVFLTSGVSS